MTLAAGTRLGPYEIVSALGAGGMGEVYLARDTRLARDVAIKVLPPHLADTPEARARFEREARAVSSLNHPNICTLYDIGRENGTDFLVLERIEGETLAARLARGALPVDEAVRLGVQIADALDRAHRGGLIHRDLKPGNIMLTKSGAKLLDFGLARPAPLAPAGGSGSMAPTLTTPLTAEGSIVGTFQYMAPEQLEGKESDARTDLWSFGAVLYEALTARRAFEAKSQASLIAAILERQPQPASAVTPMVPPALDRLIQACLAKDAEDRIQTAHDVKLQLQWIAEGGSQAGVPAPVAARRRSRERLAWGIAAAAIAGVATLGAMQLLRPRLEPQMVRFQILPPAGQRSISWPRISPDGGTVTFLATDSTGMARIWMRPLSAVDALPLPGTEGAGRPFWSPDGRSLAYVADGKLKKLSVGGGPSVLVSDTPGRADGSWGHGDIILLDGSAGDSLMAVPAGGGVARPASRFDRALGEVGHSWPFFLPDGERFLFIATRSLPGDRTNHIKLGRLGSLESDDLGVCESRVEFAPPNQVLFLREQTLVAQTLDLGKRALVGDPVPLADEVASDNSGMFATGPGGVLIVGSGTGGGISELVWTDRTGRRLNRAAEPKSYREISLSPDGRQAAVSVEDSRTGNEDIWVHDLERNIASRLTFDPTDEIWPIWSADGRRILYAADRTGSFLVYSKSAGGVGVDDTLGIGALGNEGPTHASADGQWIATASLSGSSWDILIRSAQGREPPRVFLNSPSLERDGAFSPNGRWFAYRSDETGRSEIYVRSFPDGQSKWQVSNSGGFDPIWTKNGQEIVYSVGGGFFAVPVLAGDEFRSGTPVELFRASLTTGGFLERRWSVTPDGERFLLNTPLGDQASLVFTVTTNWAQTLSAK